LPREITFNITNLTKKIPYNIFRDIQILSAVLQNVYLLISPLLTKMCRDILAGKQTVNLQIICLNLDLFRSTDRT